MNIARIVTSNLLVHAADFCMHVPTTVIDENDGVIIFLDTSFRGERDCCTPLWFSPARGGTWRINPLTGTSDTVDFHA